MQFFSELMDTAWNEPAEQAAALAVFKIRSMSRHPCELAAVHAYACSTIFDHCAKDLDFRSLVENGRIRFRLPANQPSVRLAMIAALRNKNYRLDNWAEIKPNPDTGNWSEAISNREECIRFLSAPDHFNNVILDVPSTLNDRIRNINSLLVAIELANYKVRELPRGDLLVKQMNTIISQLDPDSNPEVVEALKQVGRMGLPGRSEIYTVLEDDNRLTSLNIEIAKEVVDQISNRVLAACLEQPRLLSINRRLSIQLPSRVAQPRMQTECTVLRIEPRTADELKRLQSLTIEWGDVSKAWFGNLASASGKSSYHSVSQDTAEIAKRNLIKALTEARMATPEKILALTSPKNWSLPTAVGIVFLVPEMSGSLQSILQEILLWLKTKTGLVASAATLAAAEYTVKPLVHKHIKQWQEASVQKKLIGWIDRSP